MKAITESEFKDALKIVDAYLDQVNEKIKKVKSKEIINPDLMIYGITRVIDLPFIISVRLLNGLRLYFNDRQDFTVSDLENIDIKSFCSRMRRIGRKSGTELKELCDKLGIHYIR